MKQNPQNIQNLNETLATGTTVPSPESRQLAGFPMQNKEF